MAWMTVKPSRGADGSRLSSIRRAMSASLDHDGHGCELGDRQPLLQSPVTPASGAANYKATSELLDGRSPVTAEDSHDHVINDAPHSHVTRTNLLSIGTTVVFVVGESAGAGALALPRALTDTGWTGVFVLLACCLAAGYMAVILGECWNILQERFPEYRGHVRYPYPAMGQGAFGKWMRYVISVTNNITLFGASIVFLLLAAQNTQSVLEAAGVHISFCYWVILMGVALMPLCWLGSPKDFWPVGVGAMTTVMVACVLLFAQSLWDAARGVAPPDRPHPGPENASDFFSAFGVISFAFGGSSVFPTLQHDMKEPRFFPRVVTIAYTVLFFAYLIISVTCYLVYGERLSSNVLQTIPSGPLRTTIEVFMICHLLFAFIIILNPIEQELEDCFKAPPAFSWQRCVLRTALVGCVIFMAETVPHIQALLSLLGGSTLTFLTFIAPGLLYIRLCGQQGPWPSRSAGTRVKVTIGLIMAFGIVGGVAATISALRLLSSPSTFVPPCYVNMKAAGM